MRKIQAILILMLTTAILFTTGTAYAIDAPTAIQAYEEPYFISYNGNESLAEGKLLSYKQDSYIPLQDAAGILGYTLESSDQAIYLTGDSSINLSTSVNSLPKETVNEMESLRINPGIHTYAGIVIEDGKLGTPIFSKNANQRLYPASTTKIVTILLALKYGDLKEVVTIGQSVSRIPWDSSKAGVKPGDQMTLEQLLYAMMLPSGNDAAMAVAEHIGGSVEQFVQMMNQEVKRLGATNTAFTNPHGYHSPNLYTTAVDLAIVVKEAAKYDSFFKIAGTPVYTTSYKNMNGQTITKTWKNTNQLVQSNSPYYLSSVQAGKTGYTGEARHNLVSVVTKGKHDYIVVLLRGDKNKRYIDVKNLVNTVYKKRSQMKDERKKITILPFEKKLYVNDQEHQTNGKVIIADGQTWISTDLLVELSAALNKAKVSDTQVMKVSYNHELLPFGQDKPLIQNGRMLVPIKTFFEKSGLMLNWDQQTQTVKAVSSETVIQMKINSKVATVNGQTITLDVPATIHNGRTLVPIRFISEATGATVDWGRGRTLYLY